MNADRFKATASYYMTLRHINKEQLRQRTTVGSKSTFVKYFNEPDLMPIGVFNQIMKALNVPLEQQFELLREKK